MITLVGDKENLIPNAFGEFLFYSSREEWKSPVMEINGEPLWHGSVLGGGENGVSVALLLKRSAGTS